MIMLPVACGVISALLAQPADTPKNLPKEKQPPRRRSRKSLPITGLAPAKVFPNLCSYRYTVTTNSPLCQTYVDRALGFYYSYVWMEAARSFETATKHDPKCALAWWGLSRAIEKWGHGDHTVALRKAKELLNSADAREQKLILARLQEFGMTDEKITPDKRRTTAQKTLDELLIVHDDDQEAWFYRAQTHRPAGEDPLLQGVAPDQPAAPGGESRTGALLREHSPAGTGHAVRRQVHRIVAGDSARLSHAGPPVNAHRPLGQDQRPLRPGGQLEREYHKFQNVKPSEDYQYSHHLEILTVSLIHDGRYSEARKMKGEGPEEQVLLLAALVPAAPGREGLEGSGKCHRPLSQARQIDRRLPGGAHVLADRATPSGPTAEVDTLRQARIRSPARLAIGIETLGSAGVVAMQDWRGGRGPETAAALRGQDQERFQPSCLGQRGELHGDLGRRGDSPPAASPSPRRRIWNRWRTIQAAFTPRWGWRRCAASSGEPPRPINTRRSPRSSGKRPIWRPLSN